MSDFRIKTCVLGPVSTNCYLVYNQSGKEALIVDPADNGSYILDQCKELGVTPTAVLFTHGHFDHIMAAEEIRSALLVKLYASEEEAALLQDASLNLSQSMGRQKVELTPDCLVKDGQILELAGYRWQVIATPGHTAGSVCYWNEEEGVLLSGDTLFANSLGRTDLPTSDSSAIIRSIAHKLFLLPEDTMVYPGHGNPTTIGHEKVYNPVAAYRG